MSLDVTPLRSEAPAPRAEQIAALVSALDLPEGRLSTGDLERLVRAVVDRPDLWRDLVVDDTASRWWLLLHRTDDFEVKLLTWESDQESDWHDHAGSSGVFSVTDGALVERSRAADYVGVVTRRFAAGDHAAFGPEHVHDVLHESGRPAVSIHAYSPPLTGLTYYRRTPQGFVAHAFVLEPDRATERTTPPAA